MTQIYDRVALIGLGLIASSMAHAMKRAGLAGEIVGYARSAETRDIAREIGFCDQICDSATEAAQGADLIVLCVPVGAMVKDQISNLINLETAIGQEVIGQQAGMAKIAQALRVSKAGISNEQGPLGVFLLAGPSGVGKTETARCLAKQLFGGEKFLTTINMSEYQESHTVSQLKGSPPGYVGYGEGGVLTEAVRQRPYSVILLDEVEKRIKMCLTCFIKYLNAAICVMVKAVKLTSKTP